VIPSSVTTIGYSAFSGCSGLTNFMILPGVTTIGDDAFYGCSGLTELVIPSSVTTIGHAAFIDCTGLSELVIHCNMATIGAGAFYGCSGLRRLTISASLAAIGDSNRDVFCDVKLDRLTLVGSPLDPAVVVNLAPALAPGARVISAALAGQAFGRFAIVAA
jgi:hypothetical protein